MTRRPPLLTLLASLAVHGGGVALVFFLVSGELPDALFVDLSAVSEQEAGTREGGLRQAQTGAGRPVARAAAARGATPTPSAPSRAPSSPPESTLPRREVPTEPLSPADPRQPDPAAGVLSERGVAADLVAPSASSRPGSEWGTLSDAPGAGRIGSASDTSRGRDMASGPAMPGDGSGGTGAGVVLAAPRPNPGDPGSEYDGYLAHVWRRIQESLRYPLAARRRGITGIVKLEILIRGDGAISAVSVVSSSSHRLLDEAALEAVRSLAPQPFPADLVPRPLRVWLPVVFELQ